LATSIPLLPPFTSVLPPFYLVHAFSKNGFVHPALIEGGAR
jgi:hypothetical protein